MSGIPKRVKNAKILSTNKRGGSRSGMLSGIVSTSARAVVSLFRTIKRRTGKNKLLLKLISDGESLDTLIQEGFTGADLVKTIGYFPTFNLLSNEFGMLNVFEGEGISNDELAYAGVAFDKNGNADFKNLDLEILLKTTSMTPVDIIISGSNIFKKIQNDTNMVIGTLSFLETAAIATDVSTLYNKLNDDDLQQTNKFLENMGLSQEIALGDWLGILRAF